MEVEDEEVTGGSEEGTGDEKGGEMECKGHVQKEEKEEVLL